MLAPHFYHQVIRKTIISFGTLFNNMEVRTKTSAGTNLSVVKVPIAYGPVQKFLARLEQRPELRTEGAARTASSVDLPRMSFEMVGIQYDGSRKVSTMQTFKAVNTASGGLTKTFMPVPYNINIQLNVLAKLNEDALQIVEQILPYFQPSFNLTIDMLDVLGEKKDVPIVLESISFEDNYTDDYLTRREIVYTLNFTAKTYMYGPRPSTDEGLIKKVQVDYQTDTSNLKTGSRQVRYTAEPLAIKDYNNDATTTLAEVINSKVVSFEVSDATSLVPETFIEIDSEIMKIKSIAANRLTVRRGEYGSMITQHDFGAVLNAITPQDTALIEPADDFGFSEFKYDYNDGKVYSPSKGEDV
jgi:hypothetical protein